MDSASTGGTWDISNADRIGKGEVQLCNVLIEGAAKIVKWENMLETGQGATVEAQIAEILPQYPPLGLCAVAQRGVRVCCKADAACLGLGMGCGGVGEGGVVFS